MPDRTADSFTDVLNYLLYLAPNWNPSTFVSDYDRAQMLAVRRVFPGSRIVGCFWHYANVSYQFFKLICPIDRFIFFTVSFFYFFLKAVCRNARRLGLTQLMRENPDGRMLIRMTMSLTLCPPWLIRNGMEEIQLLARRCGLYDTLLHFFQYVWQTWINGVGEAVISVYRSRHRTTNANESHHRTLNARVGVRRPSVWRFLGVCVCIG